MTERMIITGTGNVGINTVGVANPNAVRLDVIGSNATTSIETADTFYLGRREVVTVKNANTAGFSVGSFETGISGRTRLDIKLSGSPGAGNSFGRVPDVTVMTLNADGHVGLGTTSPQTDLQIAYNGNISGGNILLGAISDSTTKWGVIAGTQFAATAEPEGFVGISTVSSSTDNTVTIGGGYSEINSASVIRMYTASNTTTRNGTERLTIDSSGNVGINKTSGIAYRLEVNGSFAATTKSFDIEHPTKEGQRLKHGSLEGPENGVYVRSRGTVGSPIQLPDYWTGLVHDDSITVQVTPIGAPANLYVADIADNTVTIGGGEEGVEFFYLIQAERKDVEKLVVEYAS